MGAVNVIGTQEIQHTINMKVTNSSTSIAYECNPVSPCANHIDKWTP